MAETKMQLVDWLDDLCVRFVINLPQEELQSVERICFQVEEAQWFYEDFVRPLDAALPSLSLRQFCLLMFQHCPLLAPFPEHQHIAAFDEFLAYKVRVPVRGAIMLNDAMDEVVLVRGWKKGANWSFPRGKINKDEDDLDCAIREVYEETGLDLGAAGLVPPASEQKFIEVTMREQHMKLFVFKGVPQDTVFQPRTRKEISKINWYKLANLPGWRKAKHKQGVPQQETLNANKFYMVAPFLQPLKRWINEQKKRTTLAVPEVSAQDHYITDDGGLTEAAETHHPGPNQYQQPVQQYEVPQQSAHDLLALLKGGQQPAAIPQSAMLSAPSSADAGDRLRQLLSVTPSHGSSAQMRQPEPASTPSQGNDLLAMLRHGSTALAPPMSHPGPPKTPIDQIANIAYEPRRPAHHHPRPSQPSPNKPPPDFAFSPARMGQQQAQNNQYYPPPPPLFAPSNPGQLAWNAPAEQQIPRPYEQTGDPQFAQDSSPFGQGPIVPAPSQLPAPRLSNHAMNLLSAFKSTKPTSASPSVSQDLRPANGLPTLNNTQSALLGLLNNRNAQQPSATESRARQALGSPPDTISSPPAATNLPQPVVVKSEARDNQTTAAPAKAPTAHQSSLLSLLRTPSAMAPQVVESADDTAKLDAQPSYTELPTTPNASLQPGNVQIMTRKHSPGKAVASPNRNLQAQTPQSSPMVRIASEKSEKAGNTDTGTVRRKPRARIQITDSPGMSDSSTGRAEASARKARGTAKRSRENADKRQVEPKFAPTQILKRPAPADSQVQTPSASPEKPEAAPAPTTPVPVLAKVDVSPTKPFQPQILRRPQTASPSAAVELPATAIGESLTPNVEKSTEEDARNKTQALLSLFQKPEVPAPTTAAPPPTTSPPLTQQTTTSPDAAKNTLLSLFAKPTTPASAMPSLAKSELPQPNKPELSSRRSSTKTDHQASLLSLFGQAKPAPTPRPTPSIETRMEAGPSGLVSPVSMMSIGSNERRGTPGGTIGEFKRSSLSSALSGQNGEARPRINSTTSRDGIGSGSQTPISSTDRGFLLNYLKGL